MQRQMNSDSMKAGEPESRQAGEAGERDVFSSGFPACWLSGLRSFLSICG
jgi:hypothetical protein